VLQISNLTKHYGNQTIFDGASLVLNQGERLGLIGRNGSGKSTLFKLVLDEEHPESGVISIPKGYRIGRLSQHLRFTEPTILAEAALGLPEEERDLTYKAEIILSGLGFSEADFARHPDEFSGGFQIRVNLAKLILSEPDLLLLDEPTNYLDILSARWLKSMLQSWKRELIIITHDRDFMDSVTTHTALIYRGTFRKIPGGTQKLYDTISLDEEVYEKTRMNDEKKRKELEQFINRFRAKASKAALVQSRVKALEKMEVKDALSQEDSLEFAFRSIPFFGKTLLEAQEITFGYQPTNPLISKLTFSMGKKDRIGIIGKNGQGKSTLLRLLAADLSPQHGQVSYAQGTRAAYFGQTNVDRLDAKKTIEEEITSVDTSLHRTKVRGICGTMMFEGDAALKKIQVLSGGEKARVLLGKILVTPSNLLLLDEPTNHLDMDSVEALTDALESFDGGMILVTHDEGLLRALCTRLIIFQGKKPFLFEGTYDDFLEKIGWEEESEMTSSRTEKSEGPRRGKEVLEEKAKKAKDKKVAQLEKTMHSLEEKQRALETELDAASSAQDIKSIEALSVRLFEVIEQINATYASLEQVYEE
jgi:ATP-binding cassette subfamily F protein 3